MNKSIFCLTPFTSAIYRSFLLIVFIVFLFIGTSEQWLVAFLIYVVKGLLGTSVIHRCLTHRAFKMYKYTEYPLAFLALVGTGVSVLVWVATHRLHHTHSDTVKDPHSPLYVPWYHVQFGTWANNTNMLNVIFVSDLLKNKFYVLLHNYHWLFALVPPMLLYYIDPLAPLYMWFIPNFITMHAGSLVNCLNHLKFGYRNFDTKDNSYNNILTGIFCLGEGWHNNHHKDPKNVNFGVKWYEFDLGYQFSKLIRRY